MGRARTAATLFLPLALPACQSLGSEAEMEKVRTRVVQQGRPCVDAAQPCEVAGRRLKPNELTFHAPVKFDFDRGEDRSAHFYAAILKSAPLCSLEEDERQRVQAIFGYRKVFLHRFHCDGFADLVTYTNIDPKQGFIAVHAGTTEAAAKLFLGEARKHFPGAYLKRMQVVVKWQIE